MLYLELIIGGHMYRNTFGIGHTLKEITEAHNTRHPNDPHKGFFGISHDGITDTINNSLHFQLGLALASLGAVTSLVLLLEITLLSQLYILTINT